MAMRELEWHRFSKELGDKLDAFHAANPELPGMGLEQLRETLRLPLPAPLFEAALKKLAESGEIAFDRMWVRRPHHVVDFSAEEERLAAAFLRELDAKPYRPPRVRDIAKAMDIAEEAVRRLLRMSARRGEVEEAGPRPFLHAVRRGRDGADCHGAWTAIPGGALHRGRIPRPSA